VLAAELIFLHDGAFDMALMGFDPAALSDLLGESDETELPALRTGDRQPFQQMAFTVHDSQKEQIDAALAAAKKMGPFDSENQNSNGNALARICETFLTNNV